MFLFSSHKPGHSDRTRPVAIRAAVLLLLAGSGMALADPAEEQPATQLPQVVVTSNRLLANVRPFSSPGQPHAETLPGTGLPATPPYQGAREPYAPFFEIDWSLGLRASRSAGTKGAFYGATLVPQFSATRTGLGSAYSFSGEARLGVNSDQLTRVEQIVLSAQGQYELDRVSQLTGNASLTLSQDDPNAPGTGDQIVQTPLVAQGQLEAGFLRRFGRLGLSFGANFLRRQTGDTLLVGNRTQTNLDQNTTRLGTSLRLQYELTPIIDGFVEGSLARDWFDAPSPGSGKSQDGWDYALTTGLAGNWRDVFALEASIGYGLRRFGDASIDELSSTLYAVDFTYTPSETFAFDARLGTTISPENTGTGDPASVDYALSAGAGFQLAPWVGLRGSLSQNWDMPVRGDDRTVSFSAGAGADFGLNKNLLLSVDYLYTRARTLPAAPEDAQEAAISLTWSK